MMRKTMILALAAATLATVSMGADVDVQRITESLDKLKARTWGQGGDLRQLDTSVAMASKDASARTKVEAKLIEVLTEGKTLAAKSYACRLLRTVGTARCVPQLASMLADPATADIAMFALARIEAPQAGAALEEMLPKTSGRIQAGVINALVTAGRKKATPAIAGLVGSSDRQVAAAAVRAIGKLGEPEAVATLQKARSRADGEKKIAIDDALLNCADALVAAGNVKEADGIYNAFYTTGDSEQRKLAGLRGLLSTRGKKAAGLLVQAIQNGSEGVRRNAISMMALTPGQATTDTFVQLLQTSSPDVQELVILALAQRGDTAAAPAVMAATTSKDTKVCLAACEALGQIGGAPAIRRLAETAATTRDRQVNQVARSSLLRLGGAGIDAAFFKEAGRGETKTRVEIVRAMGARRKPATYAAIREMARTEADEAVRQEAIATMGRLAQDSQLGDLLQMVLTPKQPGDRSAIERAAANVLAKAGGASPQAGPILAALAKAPDDAKPTLLRLLPRRATGEALAAVRGALKSADPGVAEAAVRALGDWPNADCAGDLYALATGSDNARFRALAFRGYVRVAPMADNPTAVYVRAMKLARDSGEVRMVLGGLGHADTPEALQLAEKYTTEKDVRNEAYMALVKVARNYGWQDAKRSRAALNKAIAESGNENIRREARRAIDQLDRWKGHVLAWEAVGPYMIKGVLHGDTVFRKVFAPEKNPDDPSLEWKRLRTAFEGDRLNLESTFGPVDYCAGYLRTTILSKVAQEARIEWSVDDLAKGWINGKEIRSGKLPLRKGENKLMLKVGDHAGGWAVSVKLTDLDRKPLENVTAKLP